MNATDTVLREQTRTGNPPARVDIDRIDALPLARLDGEDRMRWQAMLGSNPALESPFFALEFSDALAQVRSDLQVARLWRAGEPVGYLPYHRHGRRFALPVGERMSDYHGIISATSLLFDPNELIRAAGVHSFAFDHWIGCPQAMAGHVETRGESPRANISQGLDDYLSMLKARKSGLVQEVARLRRKLARELGPVRFEALSDSQQAMDALVQWKSAQYRASGLVDNFSIRWVCQLLDVLRQSRAADCTGTLSALYAGDTILSVHFGMRSQRVWHLWLTAYDHRYAKYSPGKVKVMSMIEAMPGLGLEVLDFGKGGSFYKEQFTNEACELMVGHIDSSVLIGVARRSGLEARNAIKRNQWLHSTGKWLKRRWRGSGPAAGSQD